MSKPKKYRVVTLTTINGKCHTDWIKPVGTNGWFYHFDRANELKNSLNSKKHPSNQTYQVDWEYLYSTFSS